MKTARIVSAIGVFATLASTGYITLLDQSAFGDRVAYTLRGFGWFLADFADQLVAAPVMIGFSIILSMLGAGAVMIWLA